MTTWRIGTVLLVAAFALSSCATEGIGQVAPAEAPPPAGVARLVIEAQATSDAGPVLAAIFLDEESYRAETALTTLQIDIADGAGSASVEGLAPGAYAIKAFQDLDGDGELDRNAFGIPSEPVAFSNGAKIRFGPPSWEAARFIAPAGETVARLDFRG